jgi:hypothetical protein
MIEQTLQYIHATDNGRFKSFLCALAGGISDPLKNAATKIEIQTKYGLDVVIYLDEFREPVAVHMFPKPKGQL